MNGSSSGAALSGRRLIASLLVASASTWLYPAPALAHGSLSIGDFYTGMLHPVLHFETLLPTLALALWSGQLGQPHAWRLPSIYLAAALLGAAAGLLDFELRLGGPLLRFSMLPLGLLVAVRGKLPALVAVALVFLLGLCSGQMNTYEPDGRIERPVLFVAGLGSCIGLVLFHVVTRVLRHRDFWVQTGVRVLGSWIAATGLLVVALDWAAGR